jgi:hypothetical protein
MDTTPRSAATRIGTAACSAATVVTLALAGHALAGDWVEPKGPESASVAVWPAAPWVQPTMDPETRAKLTTAFALAVAHVEASPECAELFADLDADGPRS